MIGRIAFLTAMVAAPSTFAIGYWQAQNQEPETQIATPRVNAPVLAKPGSGAAGAARYFAGLNAPPPPPPVPTVVVAAPAGPPPIDVGVQFRREVTAVLTQGEPHVLLVGNRKLAVGDAYGDGWKVGSLNAQNVTLTKGKETRNVNLFSAPPTQTNVQLASNAPIFTGPLGLTNGMTTIQRVQQLMQNPNMTPQQRTAALAQLSRTLSPAEMQAALQAMRGQGNQQGAARPGQGGQGANARPAQGGQNGQGNQAGGGRGAQTGAVTVTRGFNGGGGGGFNGGFGGGGGGGFGGGGGGGGRRGN